MRFWALLAALLIFLPSPARAAAGPEGRWVAKAGGTPIMLIELKRERHGWAGTVTRPKTLQISTSQVFRELQGPAVTHTITRAIARDGALELTLSTTRADDDPTILIFRIAGGDRASFGWKDAPIIDPIPLSRAGVGDVLPPSWDPTRSYAVEVAYRHSAEMAAIFEADQADRAAGPNIDWAVVGPRDTARRARVREMLDSGGLDSGDDFFRAAFIFQHGGESDSYLLAHTLAVIAAARGRRDATWIAAATLDRYLQSIGRKQIYGTQFSVPPGKTATQEPYDKTLLSDRLRRLTGVDSLAEQEARRIKMEADHRAAANVAN